MNDVVDVALEVRELRAAGELLPVDVTLAEAEPLLPKATKISAYDFSRGYSAEIYFGLGSVPATLRALADKVERRQILAQRVQVITEADQADYTRSALIFEYVETNREPREIETQPCPECATS